MQIIFLLHAKASKHIFLINVRSVFYLGEGVFANGNFWQLIWLFFDSESAKSIFSNISEFQPYFEKQILKPLQTH